MKDDDIVHIRLSGPMALLLARVNPTKCDKYLTTDKKGKAVMYVRLKKALCGTLQASLLFWQDLSQQLKDWGFKPNPSTSV